MLALQDAFPEAFDLRPHHMTLAEVRGERGAECIRKISQKRARIWDHREHKRSALTVAGNFNRTVQQMVTGQELVWSVVRNPYDFFTSCYVRRGGSSSFESFVGSYNEDPYVREGRIYYHEDDCDMMIKYEQLQPRLNKLMKQLGLRTFRLERHNETQDKKPWETYYTPKAFEIVNDRFGKEFEGFYPLRTE